MGEHPSTHDYHPASGSTEGSDLVADIHEQKTVISQHLPLADTSGAAGGNRPSDWGNMLSGQRLGHFSLEEFVGGGGMGAVFRATDTMLGRTVAVKVVGSRDTDEETLRRFRNEAQSAARLDHENIARVYYVGEDQGWNYIVFEFIEGVNIRDLVEHKGPLSLDESFAYVLQVADALAHAAERDVVHRDIKPSNVLVTSEGKAKLVDMGLARLHQEETTSEDLTASGVTLGTFDYISPEQARDPRTTDVRSDLYSLGCTLFYMLTGAPPFADGTVLQKLLSHSSDEPPDPRLYRDDLTDEAVDILMQLLAKNPQERFQSPRELMVAVHLVAEDLDLPSASRVGLVCIVPPPPAARPAWERHLPWAVPVAILLLAVVMLDWFSAPEPVSFSPPDLGPLAPPTAASEPGQSGDLPPTDPPVGPEVGPGRPASDVATQADPGGDDPRPPDNLEGSKPPADGGARPAPTPPASVVVDTIAVGGPDEMPADTRRVPSLLDALVALDELPGVTTIELRSTHHELIGPLDIILEGRKANELTIRAAPDVHPLVVMRAPALDPVDQRLPALLRVHGGRLSLDGVHLYFEVPQEGTQSWALLHLDRVKNLNLHKSSLTIRNEGGSMLDDRIAFVQFAKPVAASVPTESETPITVESPVVPNISFLQTIVRGPANLFRSEGAMPFKFSWRQGMLVTTQRLLDMGGARRTPRFEDGQIDIELRNVTAAVGAGLCLLRTDREHPFQLNMGMQTHNCFVITDGDQAVTPLVEYRGLLTAGEVRARLLMDGAGNYYQNTGVILRIDQADEDVQQDYTFDTNDRQLGRAEGWYREVEPKPAAMVNQQIDTPADRSVDRHTPTDYLLKQLDPAMEFDGAGFDPRELPRLPAGLPAEAASTGGPPSSGSSEAARGDAEPSTP